MLIRSKPQLICSAVTAAAKGGQSNTVPAKVRTLKTERYKLPQASKRPTLTVPLSGLSCCENNAKYGVEDTSLRPVTAV